MWSSAGWCVAVLGGVFVEELGAGDEEGDEEVANFDRWESPLL